MKRAPWGAAVVALVFTAVAARLLWLCDTYAVNVVFWDQWDFLTPEFDSQGPLAAFFRQHGPHRQGVGAWLMWLVHALTRWDGRAEAFTAALLMFAAAALFLFFIKRTRGALSASDAAVPLLFCTVHAFELYVGTVNFSHGPVPVLLVVAFVLALTIESEPRRLVVLTVVDFLAIYTGFGLFLGFVAPVVVGTQLWAARADVRRRRRLGLALFAMLASLASFRIGYVSSPAVACFHFPHETPSDYLLFMGRLAARVMGGTGDGGIRVQAGVGLVAILAATCGWAGVRLLRTQGKDNRVAAIFVLTGFSLLFGAATAVGRVCLGVDAGESPRYVAYTLLGFSGLYLGLRDVAWAPAARVPLLTGVVLFLGLKELSARGPNRDLIEWYAKGKRAWVACYLAKENLTACNQEAGFSIHPTPKESELERKLALLKERHLSLFKN